jgi:acetyl esterase/lipase
LAEPRREELIVRNRILVSALAALALIFCQAGDPAVAAKRATITVTQESYGSDPAQVVTVSRLATATGKTVIFLHGGGWTSGGPGSLAVEAAEWAKTGWVAINVSYRLGVIGGAPDDGKKMLADIQTVLTKYRAAAYVDPTKIVLYGESAGGHLATWLGAVKGAQIAATIAISPVSSVAGAIIAGKAAGAPKNVRDIGAAAQEFFGYSVGTTDAHRYLDRAKNMFIAFSTDEWIDPDVHGRVLCTGLGAKCKKAEYPGTLHAGDLVEAQPQLAVDARHWAGTQI